MNRKLRVRNANEILNLSKIVASKLAFDSIVNPRVDTPASGIVTSHHLTVPAYSSPALPWLCTFTVSLVGLDAFSFNLFLAPLIDGGKVKLLAEVIANHFGDNSSVIVHPPHDGYISEEAPNMLFEFGVSNLSLSINIIFDA